MLIRIQTLKGKVTFSALLDADTSSPVELSKLLQAQKTRYVLGVTASLKEIASPVFPSLCELMDEEYREPEGEPAAEG